MTGELKPTVLVSRTNPDGWKLEELMVKLRHEMHIKQSYIEKDPRPQAKAIHANNERIIEMMRSIQTLQEANMDAASTIGPDQGPSGTPCLEEGPKPA